MKKSIIVFITAILGHFGSYAQADPNLDLNMSPAIIALNGNSILEATVNNFGSNDIVANSMVVQISVGTNAEILGLAAGSNPDWTVISSPPGAGNTFRVKNTSGTITQFNPFPIPIKFTVKGVALGGPSNITGNIAYIPAVLNPLLPPPPFGAPNATQGNSDNTNDNPITSLTVVTILPLKFGSISVEASDCSANLKWNTLMEEDATTFDVEISKDGYNFSKVATVAGHKSLSGAAYEYAYLQGNGKAYYRLKMGNATGGYLYSKIISTSIKCNAKKVSIYPNPIQNSQIMKVTVDGFEGKVKGELIAADGKLIMTKVLQNGLNNVEIRNLPQGTYSFKVTDDANEIQNYKIVVVK